ncbi:MAG TPA: hypothetical protein VHL09_02265 [Dehalococcoidia bacterium]|nr:hypothetical protein [Dehalococcoidia bacterium]
MTIKVRPLDLAEGQGARPLTAKSLLGPRIRALATALFLGFLAVYFFTLSAQFAPDGVAFARLVDAGRLNFPGFFQAEHLFYPFVGWIWYQGWRFFGFEQGSLAPLQILNVLGGATGVTAVFLAARLAFGTRPLSLMPCLLSALVVGTTQAYWLHSTDAEDMILAVAMVAIAFCLLLIIRRQAFPCRSRLITLGGLLGLSALLHGTQVLFWPVALGGLYWPRRDWRSVAWAGGTAVAISALVFLVVGLASRGFRSSGDFAGWLTSAPRVGVWGRPEPQNLTTGLRTAVEAVVNGGDELQLRRLTEEAFDSSTLLALVGTCGVVTVAVATAVILLRYRHRLLDRWLVGVCLAWLALFVLFALFWAPEDVQFWITPIIPATLLATTAYLTLQSAVRTPQDLLAGLTLFGLTALITINAVTSLVPRSEISLNLDYQRAVCLGQRLGRDDLVISAGWDWVGTYVPYFTPLDYLSVTDVHVGPGRRDPAVTRALIAERIAAARSRGGQVWTVHLFDLEPSEQMWLERATGLTPDQLAEWRGDPAGDCHGAPIRGVPPS